MTAFFTAKISGISQRFALKTGSIHGISEEKPV